MVTELNLQSRYDILSQQQISVPRPFDLDTLENEEELESNLSSIPLDRGLSSKVPHKSGDGFTAPRAARHFYCKYTLKVSKIMSILTLVERVIQQPFIQYYSHHVADSWPRVPLTRV